MPAINYDLLIEQGTTWSVTITLKKPTTVPFDLTGFTARCQLRRSYSASEVLVSPTTTIPDPKTDGKIILSLTSTQTTGLEDGSAVYDVELVGPTGDVARILQGKVKITPEVTK